VRNLNKKIAVYMLRTRSWGGRFLRWLAEPRMFFVCITVIASALYICYAFPSEDTIRIIGCVLQLFGMAMAISGLLKVREYFNQPLLRTFFKSWINRFPKWSDPTVLMATAAHLKLSGSRVTIDTWSPDDKNKSIPSRIDCIVANLEGLRQDQGEFNDSINKINKDLVIQRQEIKNKTEKIEEDFNSNLESLHTGDLKPALIGLIWIALGIIMSTLPEELFSWVF